MSVSTHPGAAAAFTCHPCFDEAAHARVGRVHLPVAPRCPIRCGYCDRRTCAHLGTDRPGWAARVLTSEQELALVERLVREQPADAPPFVVGVAGPGEPLANEATFETLALVHQAHPTLVKCLSTNGLLLERSLPRLLAAGVSHLTVTVNACRAEVGAAIYDWVRDTGRTYRGPDGAALLIERQIAGIRAALAAGLALKVNTVLVPGVNDAHVAELSRVLADLGVRLMNLVPLIPAGRMAGQRAPTCEELRAARAACEVWLPQFRLCEQCRADVVRFPGRIGSPQEPVTIRNPG